MPISSRSTLSLLLLSATVHLHAQPNRILTPIDPAHRVFLRGNTRPTVLRRNDLGRMNGNLTLTSMTLFLKASARQQSELQQLLDAQQDPRSALYHHWLTPDEFADRFGMSKSDIAVIASWLRMQGFTVGAQSRSRRWIVFSGRVGQIEQAFRTEIHQYSLAGKVHYANAASRRFRAQSLMLSLAWKDWTISRSMISPR
jgi:hypothetical protein